MCRHFTRLRDYSRHALCRGAFCSGVDVVRVGASAYFKVIIIELCVPVVTAGRCTGSDAVLTETLHHRIRYAEAVAAQPCDNVPGTLQVAVDALKPTHGVAFIGVAGMLLWQGINGLPPPIR